MSNLVYIKSLIPYKIKKPLKYIALRLGIINKKDMWPKITKKLKRKFINEVNLLGSEETLSIIKKTIINKKKGAYLRFGDGDVLLMMGYEDSLHKNNSRLSHEMLEAFKLKGDYLHKSLPIQSNLFGYEKEMISGMHLHRDIDALNYLSVVHKFINLNQIFSTVALHHISIIDKEYCIGFLQFLKSQNPIFVGNHNTREIVTQKLFGKPHIKTPSSNSYDEIDRIEHELIKVLDNEKEFRVVVVSMGCPGRILQKRIVAKGYNVYLFDFGSLLDALNGKQTRTWIKLAGSFENYDDLLKKI